MEDIGKVVNLETFVPRYLNQAIIFTGDDMGGDKAMVVMLLYIVIVIMAFVFGITISNTIRKEAGVIGTLRASGYTRRELILHYMTLPVLVTLIGALIGNILGYTVFKGVCAGMYYGSYSLPCDHMECGGVSSDNGSAGYHYDPDQLCSAPVPSAAFTP